MKEYYWQVIFEDDVKLTIIGTSILHVLRQIQERIDTYYRNAPESKVMQPAQAISITRGRPYLSMDEEKDRALDRAMRNLALVMGVPVWKAREIFEKYREDEK